jgi:hypothetical protein
MSADDFPADGEIIRAKWLMDGAATLEDAAARAEEFAAYLRTLAAAGYGLYSPIEDDYGFLRKN